MAAASKKADQIRDDTADVYEQANADFKDTISAIADAISALEDAGETTESLVQKQAGKILALVQTRITEEQRSALASYANGRPEQKAAGDRGAHVDKYVFKSGNVIELLK